MTNTKQMIRIKTFLFFIYISMKIQLLLAARNFCRDPQTCTIKEHNACNEQFSSISCKIKLPQQKRCTITVCVNNSEKSYESNLLDLNELNISSQVQYDVRNIQGVNHCYVTCCLKQNNSAQHLCYDNDCQHKSIHIFHNKAKSLSTGQEICLSGSPSAIQKTLLVNQLGRKLMEVNLKDEVYFGKPINLTKDGKPCESESWEIYVSDGSNWEKHFERNVENCILKTKEVITGNYTLLLTKKMASKEIWHFLVVEPASSAAKKVDTTNKPITSTHINDKAYVKNNLSDLINSIKNIINTENENKIEKFVDQVNDIASDNFIDIWKNQSKENRLYPTKIMTFVDTFLDKVANNTNFSEHISIDKKNIAFQFSELKNDTISANLEFNQSLKVHVIDSVTQNLSSESQVFYSIVYYKSLTYLIQNIISSCLTSTNNDDILSDILGFTIHKVDLENPIENITFKLNHKKLALNTKCAYWSSNSLDSVGQWKTDGCTYISGDESYTECTCHHLTNFAILMSHHETVESSSMDIVSIVAGGTSIFAVFLTIICYIILWKYVTTTTLNKSRAIILLNLCVSMFIANLLFLLSDKFRNDMNCCKAISILLHFFYLVVFFTMLMEGIDIFITIVFVFTKIDVKKLIIAAWAFPALIVAISVGVSQSEGYGELDHCWLSQKKGLKWAFMGPAFIIIFINLIITAVVLQNMLKNSEMLQKSVLERARAGMWGLILFTPILGFTWCFGIFLLHRSVVVQYAFVVCHSIQGVLVFLLHCVFSKQIKEGLLQYMRKFEKTSHITNSVCKSVAFDKTMSPTMTFNPSMDNLSAPYPQTLEIFQSRKSQDLLVPPRNGTWYKR